MELSAVFYVRRECRLRLFARHGPRNRSHARSGPGVPCHSFWRHPMAYFVPKPLLPGTENPTAPRTGDELGWPFCRGHDLEGRPIIATCISLPAPPSRDRGRAESEGAGVRPNGERTE